MSQPSLKHRIMIFAISLTFVSFVVGCGNSTNTPDAPTGLTISSTVSQNVLSWNAVSGCVYNVYRGTAAGVETAIAGSYTATYTDTPPVTLATPYFYFVTALNNSTAVESVGSNEVSVVPPVLAPGTVTSTSIALSWTIPASVSGVTSYNIYRSSSSGSESLPVLASSAKTSYADTAVVHGTTYYYRVTAVGQKGETLGSNEISATP